MDLIEKQVLQLTQLKFAVLDEADQMLDMGFKDELEKIFAAMGKTVDRQLLLFSATLPPWVKKIAGEYCQNASSLAEIDLVGGGKDGLNKIVQASTDVKAWRSQPAGATRRVPCITSERYEPYVVLQRDEATPLFD